MKQRNDDALQAGRGRATTAGATISRRTGAPRAAPRAVSVSIRFRTPDDEARRVRRRRTGRGVRRLVDDHRFRDRPLERHARLLPGQRRGRHRHADHARAARRDHDSTHHVLAFAALGVPAYHSAAPPTASSAAPAAPTLEAPRCGVGWGPGTRVTCARRSSTTFALLGWSPGDDPEVLERNEMVAPSTWAGIKHWAASLDHAERSSG